jgi:hypothetical protein
MQLALAGLPRLLELRRLHVDRSRDEQSSRALHWENAMIFPCICWVVLPPPGASS